ncbi:MAG: hypothetical protein NVSMB65_05260 [Chloroflexota bacterium]
MMGKDHLWYGLSAGGTCALLALTGHLHLLPHPGPIDATWLVAASGVGSLVPDFDEPGSLISNAPRNLGLLARRMIYRLGVGPLRPLAWVAGMIILAASAALNWVSRFFSSVFRVLALGHREGSHWLPVWAAASAGVYLLTVARLGLWPGAGFALGFLTHLIADGLTKAGLPLVPSTRRRLHLLPRHLRIRTGSRVETVVTVIYTLILGAVLGAVLVR